MPTPDYPIQETCGISFDDFMHEIKSNARRIPGTRHMLSFAFDGKWHELFRGGFTPEQAWELLWTEDNKE